MPPRETFRGVPLPYLSELAQEIGESHISLKIKAMQWKRQGNQRALNRLLLMRLGMLKRMEIELRANSDNFAIMRTKKRVATLQNLKKEAEMDALLSEFVKAEKLKANRIKRKESKMPPYVIELQRIAEYADVKKARTDSLPAEPSTIGRLKIYDKDKRIIFSCYTCENGGASTDTPNTDKRIVAREYRIMWCFTTTSQGYKSAQMPDTQGGAFRGNESSKEYAKKKIFDKYKDIVAPALHKRFLEWGYKNLGLTLYTDKLKSFINRSIFIHNGNAPQDTRGCLLLGYTDLENGKIGDSARCIENFNALIYKLGAQNFRLIIKEIQTL